MDSLKETRRQIVIALDAVIIVVAIGIIGFMVIEKMSLLDAAWMTIETLTTIGYGDIVPQTPQGRVFTLFLIVIGLSVFAFGLQASATFLLSPVIREIRGRRRTQRLIDHLQHHYLICGVGELVDNTIKYLLDAAERRRAAHWAEIYKPIDHFLDGIFGDDAHGHFPRMRAVLRRMMLFFVRFFHRSETLLDVVVVVTPSAAYAAQLRNQGLLVVEGDPTIDEVLQHAGIQHAQAMMVMLDSDTEALLTVLTARNLNPHLDITAATLEEQLAPKMIRVGANGVIAPYEVAGQFLNNATLRPAVNEFFSSILFNQRNDMQTTQIALWDDSPWIGQRLGKLNLRDRHQAAIIGLRLDNGNFLYAPNDDYILHESEVIIAVAPARHIPAIQQSARKGTMLKPRVANWQRIALPSSPFKTPKFTFTLEESEIAIGAMSGHFIICGTGRVARNATNKLDPARPFVLISDDPAYTEELLARGFRVIQGNTVQESILKKAGIEHSLAIMVAIEDDAASVLTVLNCRALSKRLLITATAQSDEMMPKLHRAGADRVIGPFQVAAQFVLLATTRPAVSDFLQYVVYNYAAGIETAELYMQHDSPWIGRSIESLLLDRLFRAGVIGIRQADGQYIYAPPGDYVLQEHEVLIVVTPMEHSDELRITAHASASGRPVSLRRGYFESGE
ncbi:MAG: NAD-binding protein [Chloroflexota bacterium]